MLKLFEGEVVERAGGRVGSRELLGGAALDAKRRSARHKSSRRFPVPFFFLVVVVGVSGLNQVFQLLGT